MKISLAPTGVGSTSGSLPHPRQLGEYSSPLGSSRGTRAFRDIRGEVLYVSVDGSLEDLEGKGTPPAGFLYSTRACPVSLILRGYRDLTSSPKKTPV